MRHLNTAPGDFTEVLYLESAFGAPTRTLHIKKKGHSVTTQYQERGGRWLNLHTARNVLSALHCAGRLGGGPPTWNLLDFLRAHLKLKFGWEHIQPTKASYTESIKNSHKSKRKIQLSNRIMGQRLEQLLDKTITKWPMNIREALKDISYQRNPNEIPLHY